MYSKEKQIRMLLNIRQKYLDDFPLDKSLSYIDQCRQLFKKYTDSFSMVLRTGYKLYEIDNQYEPPFKYLVDWINAQTPLLQDKCYGFSTKLFWIFNNLIDFPECANPNCHNKIGIGINVKINKGYFRYCCNRCAQSDEKTIKHSKATKFKKYGNENYVNYEKIKKTIKEQYGVEYSFQIPSVIEKCKQTKNKHIQENPNYWKDRQYKSEQTKIANGYAANWNNQEQAKETKRKNLELDPHYYDKSNRQTIETKRKKYGKSLKNIDKQRATIKKHEMEDPQYHQKIYEKCKATKKIRYDDEHYMEFGHSSYLQMMEDKHGNKYWNNPDKTKQTCLDRYGEICYMPYGSQKFKNRMIELYGVEHNSQCHDFRLKQQQKYIYDFKLFASSWELALYIWLKDHSIQFIFQPNVDIWYEFEGKIHKYEPDFEINDELVEIKGNHFFNKDGIMKCPYKKKTWTDNQYKKICELYEAKHQCMLKNKVKILLYDDCKQYIDYVENKYGKDYLSQFKKKSKEK